MDWVPTLDLNLVWQDEIIDHDSSDDDFRQNPPAQGAMSDGLRIVPDLSGTKIEDLNVSAGSSPSDPQRSTEPAKNGFGKMETSGATLSSGDRPSGADSSLTKSEDSKNTAESTAGSPRWSTRTSDNGSGKMDNSSASSTGEGRPSGADSSLTTSEGSINTAESSSGSPRWSTRKWIRNYGHQRRQFQGRRRPSGADSKSGDLNVSAGTSLG